MPTKALSANHFTMLPVMASGHVSAKAEIEIAIMPTKLSEIAVSAEADMRAAAKPLRIKVSESNTAAARKYIWLASGLKPCCKDKKPIPAIATGKAIQLLLSTLALKKK